MIRRLRVVTLLAFVTTLLGFGCRSRGPKPQVELTLQRVAFQIGESKLHAQVVQVGTNPLTLINLHEDE